jgi:hypothetical protein
LRRKPKLLKGKERGRGGEGKGKRREDGGMEREGEKGI